MTPHYSFQQLPHPDLPGSPGAGLVQAGFRRYRPDAPLDAVHCSRNRPSSHQVPPMTTGPSISPAVVFLGPSLPRAEAQGLLPPGTVLRPPLRRGDLDALPPGAIAVILDGVLEAGPRLPPEEAGRARQRGHMLLGAASTGALLAVDPRLPPGTVLGSGRVHDLLSRGRATEEDLVVLYAAHNLRPLTVPLVRLLCWADDARAEGRLAPLEAEGMLAALRALPAEERDPVTVARLLRRLLGLRAPATAGGNGPPLPDVKAEDARALLRRLRQTA
ncbi:TfuA-like protein [Siccirubricoccus sp. G192]|uniref:TfuA-like protein n=1 Tax=Siccirubricoccus sp. G192 TaxID=2849651 RepID=UPI001C2C203F|nr:TfuA-like protein [Siccirubricoccus sp. G192]MBV1798677.1 hypothetical protein [Siccirubricoccus sp. G192]